MARALRVEFPGAIYHATCRMLGSWRTEPTYLFTDEQDYERFIERLAERVEQFEVRLFLFVCMSNHFHLVFETPRANCSKFMHALLTAYTVYYNLRHSRHGHLLDGRFKAKLVEGDEYLLALSRYVHLNPVQIGALRDLPMGERIKALRGYRRSSYPSYIGQGKALDFVAYAPLLGEMNGRRSEWPKRYREFVESGLADSDPSSPDYDARAEEFKGALRESPRSIGSESFRERIDELYQQRIEAHGRPEDVSFRQVIKPVAAEVVLEILGEVFGVDVGEFKRRRHSCPLRAVAARCLIRYAGMSQRDVAEMLRVGSGSAISKQLAALVGKEAKDRRLRRQVKEAEQRMGEAR